MAQRQVEIGLTITRPWTIRRPYVYRYLQKRFVDQFFTDGSIRISSFQQFSRHVDEQRKDTEEGRGIISNTVAEGPSAGTLMVYGIHGENAYVLCGSTRCSKKLAEDFGCDSGIKIFDPTAFGAALSCVIPGFIGGLEGCCYYLPNRAIETRMGGAGLEAIQSEPGSGSVDISKVAKVASGLAGNDLYFLKECSPYSHQNEYRILWISAHPASPYIDVKCPDARQFCVPFEDIPSEFGP